MAKQPAASVGAVAAGTFALGSFALGALAIGAVAVGAMAIGALAIKRLRGGETPSHSSMANAAWPTNMLRPPSLRKPRAAARAKNGVTSGL